MYQLSNVFLSDNARVEVSIENKHFDVCITIDDWDKSFSSSWFSTKQDAEALLSTFFVTEYHVGFRFSGITVFSSPGGPMDALKVALENL